MGETLIQQFTKDQTAMRLFQQERLILEATERICELMEGKGITRSQLAQKLQKSKAYVTQLLDGRQNMTLRTLADVFLALGCAVELHTTSLVVTIKPPIVLEQNALWPAPWSPRAYPIGEMKIGHQHAA